ncbi:MAG: OmpP1/FadL family transporter [Bdellovibrionales bacterium]
MKHIALIALLFCFANSAWGAGYQLRYQGAESMGTAFSSAGSYGQSLSSIYYNPGLFLTQDKDQAVALELIAIYPTKAEFTSASGQVTDDYASTSLSGGLYYGYKVDDETAITVSITTPWGTSSDYDAGWDGRYNALKTDLAAINMQPVMTKKVSDKFMFSIGPQIQYMKGTLGRASLIGTNDLENEFSGDSLSVGGILALTYTPSEKTTIGFNYTSRVKHSLKGDLKFTPAALAAAVPAPFGGPFVDSNDADTEIVTPDVFTLSASHVVSDKLIGHFSASYTNWSVFKDLTLNANNVLAGGVAPISSVIPQNWEDTYMLALGSTYHMSEKMVLRGGVSYETGAVDNAFRTPRTQDADRIGLGLGASFALGVVNLDLGLNHIIYTSDIDLAIADNLPTAPGVTGNYDTSATLLRMGLEYKF